MRGCLKLAAAFGLMAAITAPAFAQGRGPGGGMGGMGGVQILANPSVQKELKLDADQIEKAAALSAETREKMMDIRSQTEGLEGAERMQKSQELMKPINEGAMKSAMGFLKPEQVKRFKQIELQQMGANAVANPEIAKKLGVTSEQAAKAKTIMDDSQAEMRELYQSGGDDRQAMMAKVQELRKETNAKVMALMTEDQKKTWKEMAGEPFEMTMQPQRAR